jgi:putative peptide zinc metalloprotease protein
MPESQSKPPQRLPPLRANLNLHPSTRTVEGAPTWVIYDPIRHRYFNIGRLEFEMLRRWETQTVEQLIEQVNQKTSFHISADIVQRLAKFLSDNQLLKVQGEEAIKRLTEQTEKAKQSIGTFLLHRYLFFRIPLFHPDRFLNATLPIVRLFFTQTFAIVLAVCAILSVYLISRQISVFLSTFPYFFSVEGILIFMIALLSAKAIHELGHGYTAKYYGLQVPTMGVAFMVMWPILYTDASDAWKLTSRRQRFWIDAAGIIAELGLAIMASLLWNFLPDGPFRSAVFMLAIATWVMTLLVNLNPFMRFDGYYILTDYLGINNLQERSFAIARWWMREKIFGFGDPIPERFARHRHRIILFYAFGTWIYRFFLFLGIALIVYFFFFKVLGTFLMMVEIIWFLIRPIYREIRYWLTRRADMRLNRNTLFSLLLLTAGIALLVMPWQTTIDAPAIYRSQAHHDIYAPMPARILAVNVKHGQHVKAGEILFTLEDPDIQYQLKNAQRQEALLKLQLQLQASDRIYLERAHVLQQQLAEKQAEIQGYKAQQAQLQITAPFAGDIVSVADALRKGRWINPSLVLARLVDKPSTHLMAYVNENNLTEISVGHIGRFYPDTPDEPPIDVKITAIDPANITQLQSSDHYIASVYGGSVPVKPTPDKHLIPQEAVYRVYLSMIAQSNMPTNRVHQGTVVLEAKDKKTLIERAWILINTVLIRESGF